MHSTVLLLEFQSLGTFHVCSDPEVVVRKMTVSAACALCGNAKSVREEATKERSRREERSRSSELREKRLRI
jgi:hypothetical protein